MRSRDQYSLNKKKTASGKEQKCENRFIGSESKVDTSKRNL